MSSRLLDDKDEESSPITYEPPFERGSRGMSMLKRILCLESPRAKLYLLLVFASVVLILMGVLTAVLYDGRRSAIPYKHVIVMISDGYGPAGQTLTRYTALYQNNYTVIYDQFLKGTVKTRSFDSLVTDSAAGATAYSTGFKTFNGGIAIDPVSLLPLGTLLEAAESKGMVSGLVVKSDMSDATPAAFSAHVPARASMQAIAQQQLTKGIEVMLGGGSQYYDIDAYKKKGYKFVQNADELDKATTTPLLGLFATSSMAYVIDKNTTQPTLPQMAKKALSLLETAKDGFFMMIEGSRIDHAGHQNDPGAYYGEALEFEQTMKLVYEWAQQATGDTLIVSVSDHETGGLALGRWLSYEETYPVYSWYPSVILAMNQSSESMAFKIRAGVNVSDLFPSNFKITTDQYNRVIQANNSYTVATGLNPIVYALSDITSTNARLGWATVGHTGVDINLYVVYDSLATSTRFPLQGNMDNTQVGNSIAQKCKFDLAAVTAELRKNTTASARQQYQREEMKKDGGFYYYH